MLYALLYIVAKGRGGKATAAVPMAKAKESITVLKAVNSKLRGNVALDANEMHDIIGVTAESYANLYYSLDSSVRASILNDNHGRIAKEENILTMPAVMINGNEHKSAVVSSLERSLYKKPLAFLQSAISTSIKMESLRASMALKKKTDFTVERLSYSLQNIEKLMQNVDSGNIKPTEDEEAKMRIVHELVTLSEQYDAHTLNYISSKLDETSFNISTAQRIIRE